MELSPNMGKEPPTTPFIQPMVDKLPQVWNTGFTLYSKEYEKYETFKLVLLCADCEISTRKKLCRFLGKNLITNNYSSLHVSGCHHDL